MRNIHVFALLIGLPITLICYFYTIPIMSFFLDSSTDAFNLSIDYAKYGFLGGLGMPVLFSWIVGGFFAAGLAYIVGKVALGLRADYLAIATLLIAEIVFQ